MSTIRMLKTFLAVSELGSFAAAAERVALTPAAVGAKMKAMEDLFKRPLFNRAGRAVTFTPAGLALVARARRLVDDYEDMLAGPPSGEEIAGTVTIGAIVSAMGALATSVVDLKAPYPSLDIRIENGRQADLYGRVIDGDLDAAILVETVRPDGRAAIWTHLYEEPLMLIAGASVAAPGMDALDILRRQPFIRLDRGMTTGAWIDQFLRRSGVRPNDLVEMNSLPAIVELVRQQAGVAIAPVLHHFGWHRDVGLCLLPLPGKPMARRVGLLESTRHLAVTGVIRDHFARKHCA
ncbi:LysR family transcriptional regulator [Cupriavidus pauculus]|uniref:LysR family transcriptional regulator n=1 Tax=Cupriavidus pauculus TaxID=82633 RepID=A0A2N5C4V9_9BURK|nr:LysR family transcriptional regulator [Cupriavidus pauculus]PLP97237.1 LysR family transcriptional regulator [Cupriavidus pauculus]